MCIKNSKKLQCLTNATKRLLQNFHAILYSKTFYTKKDKAERLTIAKTETPSEKCQAIDFLFFLASIWY